MNRLEEAGPSMTSETNVKEVAVDSPRRLMVVANDVNHTSKLSTSLEAFRGCNTPTSSPYGLQSVCRVEDTRSCMALGLATPKLNDANTRAMAASSCRQGPASTSFSSVPTYHSKRSHSFAGVATDHVMLLGRDGDDSSLSNNPSLQYLITRARRGLNKPHSAHTSPLGGTMGRLQVKVDVSDYQHQTLAKAVEELEAMQAQQPDDEDNCIRQAIADVANHCLRQTREQLEQESTKSTDVQTISQPKRNPSACEQTKRGPATTLDDADPPRNKSRRLSSSASFLEEAEAAALVSPGASQQELRPPLRLPDPSNIVNRRQLLAMSRKMCNRSSIYSFEGESNGSLQAEDDKETEAYQRLSSCSSPTNLFQCIDGVADAVFKPIAHAVDQVPAHATLDFDKDDDADSFSAAASIMSVEQDDESILSMGPTPVAAAGAGEKDDESIAFSMDSVHMRKRQFDASLSSHLNQSTRTFRTDWAVNAQIQAPCVRAAEPVAPPQHIVCEFDRHVEADEESILQQRFQFQARLWDDNEDNCSLASLQSLDTDPMEERMEELVDPELEADSK